METTVNENSAATCKVLAAIDIGSNSIRMVTGQLLEDGSVEILERFRKAVRLGQDTFRKKRLSRNAIRAVITILREYQRIIDLLEIEHVRVVATSSVREAVNADILIDRVLMSTGLNIEVIDPSEESRLTVTGVQIALGERAKEFTQNTLIAEVGGGSTILTVLSKGQIVLSQSMSLGSIRLQEDTPEGDLPDSKIISSEIKNILPSIEAFTSLKKIDTFFILGADARFAARHAGQKVEGTDLYRIPKAGFARLVNKICVMSADKIAEKYEIEFTEAETLNAALVVYRELVDTTKAKYITVSSASLRDGLLRDIARRASGKEDKVFATEVVNSAKAIAEKYKTDTGHCNRVRAISVRLFDELKDEHGLGFRQRIYLEAAALMHETGIYVSPRGFHKHSQYLVQNSEIFGLTQIEIAIVANIARYHRRAKPKTSHIEYMTLSRENRIIVNKLASILRMAESLDTGRDADPEHMELQLTRDSLNIYLPAGTDIESKRRNFATEKEMFEDIYGLNAALEEK